MEYDVKSDPNGGSRTVGSGVAEMMATQRGWGVITAMPLPPSCFPFIIPKSSEKVSLIPSCLSHGRISDPPPFQFPSWEGIARLLALSWTVEGLRRLPRRVGGPHHWPVRQSSHLAAVPLEAPDSAAARAMAPLVHLVLPKEHAILLVLGDDGELEPRVPSMQALQLVREMEWRSLAARTRAHTPLASACEAVPLGAVHHSPTHRNMLRARDGRLSTMQVM